MNRSFAHFLGKKRAIRSETDERIPSPDIDALNKFKEFETLQQKTYSIVIQLWCKWFATHVCVLASMYMCVHCTRAGDILCNGILRPLSG